MTNTDDIVLITGASRGIGAATARLFAAHGHAVAINYRVNAEAATLLASELRALGNECLLLQGDMGNEADILRVFDTLDQQGLRLAVLVNNAAILEQQCRLDALDSARIQRILQTNVLGPLLCCREAVKRMSTRHGGQGGSIVNVSSMASVSGSPNEYIDYAASKGAIDTLTRGLAREVAAEGIRVNGVRPGLIYTDMHAAGGEPGRVDRLKSRLPMQRGGQPEEVAEAIYWLASAQASFVTGSFVDLAGGM